MGMLDGLSFSIKRYSNKPQTLESYHPQIPHHLLFTLLPIQGMLPPHQLMHKRCVWSVTRPSRYLVAGHDGPAVLPVACQASSSPPPTLISTAVPELDPHACKPLMFLLQLSSFGGGGTPAAVDAEQKRLRRKARRDQRAPYQWLPNRKAGRSNSNSSVSSEGSLDLDFDDSVWKPDVKADLKSEFIMARNPSDPRWDRLRDVQSIAWDLLKDIF
ncbi:midnolin [Lates japonicus]|uniref:Midnolin n=1 Tax=Lates japonicus TaxID=270547 RepID=A0AAD3MAQ1_LATJO|nr:midnolin [Lates japonicus]